MTDAFDDSYFMRQALLLARDAEANDEVPVGAVVVLRNEIVGRGANAPISDKDPSAHAEVIALRDAAKALGNYRLSDARLYVTLEPCLMCAGAMVHARIDTVVFGATDPKSGVLGGCINVVDSKALNHRLKVVGGVDADESANLLRDFFRERRRKSLVKD